jgi:hypothetical protein
MFSLKNRALSCQYCLRKRVVRCRRVSWEVGQNDQKGRRRDRDGTRHTNRRRGQEGGCVIGRDCWNLQQESATLVNRSCVVCESVR